MHSNTPNPLIQNVGYNCTDNRHFVLCESCFGVQLFSNLVINKNIKPMLVLFVSMTTVLR